MKTPKIQIILSFSIYHLYFGNFFITSYKGQYYSIYIGVLLPNHRRILEGKEQWENELSFEMREYILYQQKYTCVECGVSWFIASRMSHPYRRKWEWEDDVVKENVIKIWIIVWKDVFSKMIYNKIGGWLLVLPLLVHCFWNNSRWRIYLWFYILCNHNEFR